jgi:glutaconyl-CoA/methylmalonyl-CoA decarboxylase subunit gamma
MKNYKFTIHGNQYEVNIISVEDNIAEIEVNGSQYMVELDKAIQQTKTPKLVRQPAIPSTDSHPSIAKTSAPSSPKGAGHVKSPLPGVILDVFVKEGDAVKKGQKLLCLEAMKMENIIDSDKDGKIIKINANKGDSVMEGDILVTIGE